MGHRRSTMEYGNNWEPKAEIATTAGHTLQYLQSRHRSLTKTFYNWRRAKRQIHNLSLNKLSTHENPRIASRRYRSVLWDLVSTREPPAESEEWGASTQPAVREREHDAFVNVKRPDSCTSWSSCKMKCMHGPPFWQNCQNSLRSAARLLPSRKWTFFLRSIDHIHQISKCGTAIIGQSWFDWSNPHGLQFSFAFRTVRPASCIHSFWQGLHTFRGTPLQTFSWRLQNILMFPNFSRDVQRKILRTHDALSRSSKDLVHHCNMCCQCCCHCCCWLESGHGHLLAAAASWLRKQSPKHHSVPQLWAEQLLQTSWHIPAWDSVTKSRTSLVVSSLNLPCSVHSWFCKLSTSWIWSRLATTSMRRFKVPMPCLWSMCSVAFASIFSTDIFSYPRSFNCNTIPFSSDALSAAAHCSDSALLLVMNYCLRVYARHDNQVASDRHCLICEFLCNLPNLHLKMSSPLQPFPRTWTLRSEYLTNLFSFAKIVLWESTSFDTALSRWMWHRHDLDWGTSISQPMTCTCGAVFRPKSSDSSSVFYCAAGVCTDIPCSKLGSCTSNRNSLSHLRCGSSLLTPRALNTPSAFPLQHPALLFRIPRQIPNFYLDCILFRESLEICFASTVSPNGMNSRDGFSPCSLCNSVFPSQTFDMRKGGLLHTLPLRSNPSLKFAQIFMQQVNSVLLLFDDGHQVRLSMSLVREYGKSQFEGRTTQLFLFALWMRQRIWDEENARSLSQKK